MLTSERLSEIDHWLHITHIGDQKFWKTLGMLQEVVSAYKQLSNNPPRRESGLDWISEHGGS